LCDPANNHLNSVNQSPLEQSATRRYVSSDSCSFPKAAQNLSFLSFVRIVTDTMY